jgi:O-antigen ligase
MRKFALIIPLLAMLAIALWYAAQSWMALDGPDMPPELYIAMGLGILFSIVVGSGLMALVFYSSRHGYDDPPHLQDKDRGDRT